MKQFSKMQDIATNRNAVLLSKHILVKRFSKSAEKSMDKIKSIIPAKKMKNFGVSLDPEVKTTTLLVKDVYTLYQKKPEVFKEMLSDLEEQAAKFALGGDDDDDYYEESESAKDFGEDSDLSIPKEKSESTTEIPPDEDLSAESYDEIKAIAFSLIQEEEILFVDEFIKGHKVKDEHAENLIKDLSEKYYYEKESQMATLNPM